MLSYVIVGSGYRAQYYGRVAQTWPEQFRAVFLCRSAEKAAKMKRETGLDSVLTAEAAEAFSPDFIVVAVDKGHIADVAEEWALRGYPVVTETPLADTEEKLERIQKLAKSGARIVCCEQYHRYPLLAAGLEAVRQGLIGTPRSAYFSALHDYHAASIIRRALMTGKESCSMHGTRVVGPATETDSRGGAVLDGRTVNESRDLVLAVFESGKSALYDFAPIQYRSYIRTRHITVRGDRGEWNDTTVYGLDEHNRPFRRMLTPEIPEKYRCLDSQALRDLRRAWRPELILDTLQDEFAIATILLDMGEYLAGGDAPYPLWEAVEDVRFWMRLRETVGP